MVGRVDQADDISGGRRLGSYGSLDPSDAVVAGERKVHRMNDVQTYNWKGAGGPFTLSIDPGTFKPSSTSGSALPA
jgi:hypothetical protein